MNAPYMALVQLTEVLDKENEALRSLDLPGAARLLADKQRALAHMEQVFSPQAAAGETNETMRRLATRLRDATLENKGLLERGMRAQRHIMSILAHAASGADQAPGYGAKGSYSRSSGAASAFAVVARA